MTLSITMDGPQELTKWVHLQGKLDSDTAPILDQQLDTILQDDIQRLIFDLKELSYISSAGLRSIFKAKKTLAATQGKVLLVHLQPQVKKVFEIINALPSLSVFASYQEMDDYLAHIQHQEMNK